MLKILLDNFALFISIMPEIFQLFFVTQLYPYRFIPTPSNSYAFFPQKKQVCFVYHYTPIT